MSSRGLNYDFTNSYKIIYNATIKSMKYILQYNIYIYGDEKMTHKYGIYQSSSKSCILYKQDNDGNQSTFNIFVTTSKGEVDEKEVFAFIDNEQLKKDNWAATKEMGIKDVIDAFGGWASDAPIVFELEAHKSMSKCLNSLYKREETED